MTKMDDCVARAERARQGNPFLNTAQAAFYLGLSARTLRRLRVRGEGPVPRRHARMVQYHIEDLERWSRGRADQRPS
jgi:hypothetical protein